MDGLALQGVMASRGIDLPTIFLTGHGSIRDSVQAMRGGAMDFLEKPLDPETLLAQVRDAVARDAALRAGRVRQAEVVRRLAQLTPREREVLRWMVTGRTCKEVAPELQISPRTVEVHRARAFEKLNASSVPDLVAMVVLSGEPDLQPHLR